jgi:hypothetical protein
MYVRTSVCLFICLFVSMYACMCVRSKILQPICTDCRQATFSTTQIQVHALINYPANWHRTREKNWNSRVNGHVHVKLFAFELPENIRSQAIFTFAAVWVTIGFFQNALYKRENRLASDVSGQRKCDELHSRFEQLSGKVHKPAKENGTCA